MSRQELADKYGLSGKAFTRRLRFHFKEEFFNVRLFTAGQVARIIDVMLPWEITIDE